MHKYLIDKSLLKFLISTHHFCIKKIKNLRLIKYFSSKNILFQNSKTYFSIFIKSIFKLNHHLLLLIRKINNLIHLLSDD